MSEINQTTSDIEMHVNEEPRNDFSDVLIGFSVSFGFFLLVGVIATLVQFFS